MDGISYIEYNGVDVCLSIEKVDLERIALGIERMDLLRSRIQKKDWLYMELHGWHIYLTG